MGRTDTRTGNALVAASVMILVLASLATGLTDLTVSNYRQQIARARTVQLTFAAESAANIALQHFQNNWTTIAPAFEGTAPESYTETINLANYVTNAALNGADITANLVKIKGNEAAKSLYRITATATQGTPDQSDIYRRKRVEMIVVPLSDPNTSDESVFANALFALEGYDFKGAATTDSWDSGLGDFGSMASTGNGDLASEGVVTVQKPNNVDGKVLSNQEFPLPVFSYDQTLAEAGPTFPLGNHSGTVSLWSAQSPYRASSMTIGNGDLLIVNGAVELFVDGPFTISKGELQFPTANSRLIVYQKNYNSSLGDTNFSVNGNTTVGLIVANGSNFTIDPSRLIFITEYSGQITFNGNGEWAGVMFAPHATFKLNGTFNYFGSIIANGFGQEGEGDGRINGTFNFHYDDQLSNPDKFPELKNVLVPRLVISAWRSQDLGYGVP